MSALAVKLAELEAEVGNLRERGPQGGHRYAGPGRHFRVGQRACLRHHD